MQKKSWFGGFLDKVKSAFKSEGAQEKADEALDLPKKQYTTDEQQLIQEIFNKFSQEMRAVKNLTTDQQLAIYGLYKQATIGDCNINEPAFYDQEGKYKYKAWMKMKGLSKTQAQEIYIQAANEFNPTINSQSLSKESQIQKRGGTSFTNSVPKPKFEQAPQYDHPYFQKMLNDEAIDIQKQLLLKMNTTPNILPLHFAIDNQKIEYVSQFLKHLTKEQANLADGEGMTSLEYAELIGNKEILELIKHAI